MNCYRNEAYFPTFNMKFHAETKLYQSTEKKKLF